MRPHHRAAGLCLGSLVLDHERHRGQCLVLLQPNVVHRHPSRGHPSGRYRQLLLRDLHLGPVRRDRCIVHHVPLLLVSSPDAWGMLLTLLHSGELAIQAEAGKSNCRSRRIYLPKLIVDHVACFTGANVIKVGIPSAYLNLEKHFTIKPKRSGQPLPLLAQPRRAAFRRSVNRRLSPRASGAAGGQKRDMPHRQTRRDLTTECAPGFSACWTGVHHRFDCVNTAIDVTGE
jgi:hypothetical protein